MNALLTAVPLFALMIAADAVSGWRSGRTLYRFADSFSNLGCLLVEQLFGLAAKATLFSTYLFVWGHARVFEMSAASRWVFLACFIGLDACYYWHHRFTHEINALWAAHAVHHQSEEYNLTVSVRLGALGGLYSWVFYLPLAVLGFPPTVFLACAALAAAYQFCVHTRAVGRLGALEEIFVTPSHHRVHHGRNPEYLDRNYGGTLIVWDRLFGTFTREAHEPVYGTVTPLKSFNPLIAHFAVWRDLLARAAKGRTWIERLRPFVSSPGAMTPGVGKVRPPARLRRDDRPARYALLQSLPLLGILLFLMRRGATLSGPAVFAAVACILLSVVALAWSVDRGRNTPIVEAPRLALVGVAILLLARG